MSMPAEWASVLGFTAALALLVTGHLVRVARWSLLLRQVGPPQPTAGFLALSLAYVVNTFVPLRLGELARVLYYASRTRTDVAYVLAATVVERAFDLVAVWILVLLFAWYGTFQSVTVWTLTLSTAGVAVAMVVAAVLVERSATFRRGIWLFASLFNSRIRLVLLDATWSVGEVLRESDTNRVRLAAQSLAMWALYIASYKLLSDALDLRLEQVFDLMHGAPLEPTVLALMQDEIADTLVLLGYTSAPFAIILGYSVVSRRFGVSVRGAFTWLSNPLLHVNRIARSRSHFSQSEQYSGFLTRRFSGATDLVSDFEAHALDDAIVQRMFRGGSDALTSMVQVKDELRIRKYALGSASKKLEAQCDWLERHASDLPLVLRQIPIWKGEVAVGFIDLALDRAFVYRQHAESEVIPLEDGERSRRDEARFTMLERLADHDDALMEQLRTVRIDMAPGFDSLNVGTAAGIALHAARRGTQPPVTIDGRGRPDTG